MNHFLHEERLLSEEEPYITMIMWGWGGGKRARDSERKKDHISMNEDLNTVIES